MTGKLTTILYNCWKHDTKNDKGLLEGIKRELKSGKSGAEHLLDWARDFYDNDKNNDFYTQHDIAWDICNWYYDYLNKDMTKKKLNELLDYYL